jgi:arginyl-tRNA synthetase
MKQEIFALLNKASGAVIGKSLDFSLVHPENLEYGDYAANLALVGAKIAGKNPRALAEEIKAYCENVKHPAIAKIEIAGPGFLNITLTKEKVVEILHEAISGEGFGKLPKTSALFGKKVMVEYTQPNPFKPFHIGHLMSNTIGESLTRIFEYTGAKVVRANYQGDVGPHVAKAIYVLLNKPIPTDLKTVSEKASYIGTCYVLGNTYYENEAEPEHKQKIDEINRAIYEKSNPEINAVYEEGRKITLEAFEIIYKKLGTKFDYYFFESEMAAIGVNLVNEYLGSVFEESQGAKVFHGENFNSKLHTRPFISGKGLPLYEAKELGLTLTKFEKENPDLSVTVTAVEQADYMRVVTEAVRQIDIREGTTHADRMKHISHGMMRLASGKMSSRKGNVITGESMIADAEALVSEKVKERNYAPDEEKEIVESVAAGAIKYSVLRSAPGSDCVYDPEKSVSFEGDSGPYLQYAVVRARSVLEKANALKNLSANVNLPDQLPEVARMITFFPNVVEHAYHEFGPHLIAEYLIKLSSSFNAFYAHNKILEEGENQAFRLMLTKAFGETMEKGLWLLGIKVPHRM